jgi:hypothetical protein
MKSIYITKKGVENHIEDCQSSNHIQQVAYSTYHKGITQVCFDCMEVRTCIDGVAGATPIETESECECACHWTKGDKPFHRYGQCKCEKPEREDENTKEEHEKIKGYVLSKAVREAEREEIDPPEQVTYARDTEIYPDFERWYRQVTNMLNRHDQLLREE